MLGLITNIGDLENLTISERMTVYEASFDFDVSNAPEYGFFVRIIEKIPQRDKIKIILQNESEDILIFLDGLQREPVSNENYTNFLHETLEDEIINVRIEISKEVKEEHFSIYCFEKFVEDLLALEIEKIIQSFAELFKFVENRIVFDLFDQTQMFVTKTMCFIPCGNIPVNIEFERRKRVQSCRENSYFYNFDLYEVVPDDFKIEMDYENNPLKHLFGKITSLLSINFIASSSSIECGEVKVQISGHRTIQYNRLISDISENPNLYKIYHWMFTDGNIIDKAIIARNIISLHCQYVELAEMDEKVLASINSNFKLYLRDNVKQYLELKNKIAEFISEIISKTGEYAMDTLEKFKGNLVAIFGFLFTVVLANIVSDQPLDNIFTRDITMIMLCVLVGSAVYLVISCLQSRYQLNKVYDSYEQLKKNYANILTEEDIAEVFNNDELIEKMKSSIKKSRSIYIVIWSVFLIIILCVIESISTDPIIFPVIKSVLQGIRGLFTNQV